MGYQYRVTIDAEIRTLNERFLEEVQDSEQTLLEDFTTNRVGDHTDYQIFNTWYRLSRPLGSNLYSYLGSKTVFNPYQFRPLLRFLSPNSEDRLFIADEVGVGKTIETGIILKELMARGRLDYRSPILIVCPYSLGPKWVKEMKDRFDLNFHLHDGDSLKLMLKTINTEGVYPQRYSFSVSPLQLIRREEHLSVLKEINDKRSVPLFRLVVVDEAHHMRNSETDSYDLGSTLSNMTEMMLMLSATPLNLRNEDLFNQMHILDAAAFPDYTTFETLQSPVVRLNRIRRLMTARDQDTAGSIFQELTALANEPLGQVIFNHPAVQRFIERLKRPEALTTAEIAEYERLFVALGPLYQSFTRSRKREALEHQIFREVHELPIVLTPEERTFHDDFLKAVKIYYLSQGLDPSAVALIMNTHRRMVSSCLPAVVNYLGWSIAMNRIKEGGDWNEEDAEDDSELGTEVLDPELRQQFDSLLERSKVIQTLDSKYTQFKEALRKVLANPETPQVMVFSFFVRTLEYLKDRLQEDGFTVGVIHGEVPLHTEGEIMGRYEIMDDFRDGKYQVLLSSEVGGEGLDFQYCHALMNYDMPYNPMRIEQRIGRIDRFGQEAEKIVIVNIFLKGTVDEEIYDRLYRRIRIIEDGVGSLEPILGKELSDLQVAIITGNLSPSQVDEIQRRVEGRIAAAKYEMEQFEEQRNELLSDDYLTERISKLSQGDFVSPGDCIQLTELFLSRREGCKLEMKSNSYGEMILAPAVVTALEQFLRKPGNEGGISEVKALTSHRPPVKVVFDGNLAEKLRDHQFLSPTGTWARFIVYELESEGIIRRNFSFKISTSDVGLPDGSYLVFLFELRSNGIKSEIEFLGLPLDARTAAVCETSFEALPRTLAKTGQVLARALDPDVNVNYLLSVARDRVANIVEEELAVAVNDNRYRVESAVAALERSANVRKVRLRQQIATHLENRHRECKPQDDIYLRLTEARIAKEDLVLNTKVKELRRHQDLSIDYSLQGIVYIEVV